MRLLHSPSKEDSLRLPRTSRNNKKANKHKTTNTKRASAATEQKTTKEEKQCVGLGCALLVFECSRYCCWWCCCCCFFLSFAAYLFHRLFGFTLWGLFSLLVVVAVFFSLPSLDVVVCEHIGTFWTLECRPYVPCSSAPTSLGTIALMLCCALFRLPLIYAMCALLCVVIVCVMHAFFLRCCVFLLSLRLLLLGLRWQLLLSSC